MVRSAWALSLVVVGVMTSFGCKLFKTSPDKACERQVELFPGSRKEKCVAELKSMKSEAPRTYDCTVRCLTESKETEEASACLADCKPSATTAKSSKEGEATQTYPVDALTATSVKTKIDSEYQHFGYDISGEADNAAGWRATVTLGKKAAYGEVHIYKVILVDVKDRKDGFEIVSGFKKGNALVETPGNKKALYVECLYQRAPNEGGTPKVCSGHDSRLVRFTDELAKFR